MGILTMSFVSWFVCKISGEGSIRLYAVASLLFDAVSFLIALAYGFAAILSILLGIVIGLDLHS